MSYNFKNKVGFVFGATSGIGLALMEELLKNHMVDKLYGFGRSVDNDNCKRLTQTYSNVEFIFFDANNKQQDLLDNLIQCEEKIDFVINSIGVLQFKGFKPEKRLEDINYEQFAETLKVNTFSTLLLAQKCKKLLLKSEAPLFVAVSAKVGSISDNKMGGWYSYRISKAALNMSLKNIALEFKQRNKNSTVISIHPGTTETPLFEPFAANARKRYQVHTADATAQNILKNIKTDHHQCFVSWDGDLIPW